MTINSGPTDPLSDKEGPWTEYKILQDKIDRIGDFQFRIKGWAVTIVLGLLVAVKNTRLSAGQFALAGGAVLFTFWWLESMQQKLQRTFARRLQELEGLMRSSGVALSTRPRSRLRSKHEVKRSPAIAWAIGRTSQETKAVVRWLERHSSEIFYIVIGLVCGAMLMLSEKPCENETATACAKPFGSSGTPAARAIAPTASTQVDDSSVVDADAGPSSAICR